MSVIAESLRLQQALATHGILSQTPTQVEPLHLWSPNQLMKALKFMGVNRELGLEGRPDRPVGLIGTSMVSDKQPPVFTCLRVDCALSRIRS